MAAANGHMDIVEYLISQGVVRIITTIVCEIVVSKIEDLVFWVSRILMLLTRRTMLLCIGLV